MTDEQPVDAVEGSADESAEPPHWGEGRLVFRRPEVGARRSAQLDVITTRHDLDTIGALIIEELEEAD